MSDGEKLHKMLEFMSKVHSFIIHTEPAISTHARKSTYTYEQLLEAFKKPLFGKQISAHEVSRLCAILTMDGLGTSMKKPGFENKIGGTIGISIDHEKVSEAYNNRKYLANEKPSLIRSDLALWIFLIISILGVFWATIYGLWQDHTSESDKTPTQIELKQQKEQSETVLSADSTFEKPDSADSLKRN